MNEDKVKLKKSNYENKRKIKKTEKKSNILKYISIILTLITSGIILFIFIKKSKNQYNKGNILNTNWGDKLTPDNVWNEYPRPQLERKKWTNLNGLWNYRIDGKDNLFQSKSDGVILVPFPIESALSGVMKSINETQQIWYTKTVTIKKEWRNSKHLLLHFGAVDYKAKIYINSKFVGKHKGGYSPFFFDIYKHIDFNRNTFDITVLVYDPSDKGFQSLGKQKLNPGGIYYTAVSGIWQTVWIEALNEYYITKVEFKNDFDKKKIILNTIINKDISLSVTIKVYYNKKVIITKEHLSNSILEINIPDKDFHPWSPDEQNIYEFEIKLYNTNLKSVIDTIKTYTTIRKITSAKDKKNNLRFKLNNKFIFNLGTLDQGYWPDGIYTPPSEEAMIYDIKKLKQLGFNTIRKHAKVEMSRYYYHCDKIGMLVWQDMPSGNIGEKKLWNPKQMNKGYDTNRSEESKKNYYKEWKDIITNFKFFQCIIIWTPFNEAWGQFDTKKVVDFTKALDPTRLINTASGGNHRNCGDIIDFHNYPQPKRFFKEMSKINVIGEYGGLGLDISNHTWTQKNWGYATYQTKQQITDVYVSFIYMIKELIEDGISAAIYTQTTDCEKEINGLITYDRKVIKIFEDKIKEANLMLINNYIKFIDN